MNYRVIAFLVSITLAMGVVGCGDGGSGKKANVGSVSGTVTYEGKPLTGGSVVFHGPDGTVVPGVIAESGKYSAEPVKGANSVTIGGAYIEDMAKMDPETKKMMAEATKMQKDVKPLPEPIPKRYGDPATSGLKFEVTNSGTFDIKLTKD